MFKSSQFISQDTHSTNSLWHVPTY